MFEAQKRNQKKVNQGAQLITPLLNVKRRLLVLAYKSPAPKKSPDDTNPCLRDIPKELTSPELLLEIIPPITSLICATEE